jgi:hypothetical protein
MTISVGLRLEQYTVQFPRELLLVDIEVDGQPDQIAIFKGFSSSLMCPTAFDPEVPMIPPEAKILGIDRLQGPYNPNSPRYIQRKISWQEFEELLEKAGL